MKNNFSGEKKLSRGKIFRKIFQYFKKYFIWNISTGPEAINIFDRSVYKIYFYLSMHYGRTFLVWDISKPGGPVLSLANMNQEIIYKPVLNYTFGGKTGQLSASFWFNWSCSFEVWTAQQYGNQWKWDFW